METQIAPKSIATSTYRRANGSQAIRTAPRKPQAGKVQPRSHTPSRAARQDANERATMARYVQWCNVKHAGSVRPESEVNETVTAIFAKATRPVIESMLRDARRIRATQ